MNTVLLLVGLIFSLSGFIAGYAVRDTKRSRIDRRRRRFEARLRSLGYGKNPA